MKNIFLTVFCVLLGMAGVQAQADTTNNSARFQFLNGETHDFGAIPEGPEESYVFRFKNVGKSPLVISSTSANCGCTVPQFSTAPVKPGKKGEIKVTFHTKGKTGFFDKIIYIQSNAPSNTKGDERYQLHIKGTVTH